MKRSLVIALVGAVAVVVLAFPSSVLGAPPPNNDFANATVITSLPFSQTVGITEATTEAGEPLWWFRQSRTVWWSFTPVTDAMVKVSIGGGSYAFLSIYEAESGGFGGLTRMSWGGPKSYTFPLEAGTTYYIQSGDDWDFGWTSTVSLTVEAIPPPVNDNFADATQFSSVPFSANVDLTAATTEPGEPQAGGTFPPSAWYAFTPTTSGSYGGFAVSGVNVYTGSRLGDLTVLACSDWPGLYFHADAGMTYYLQTFGGSIRIDTVPPPFTDWGYSPGNPTKFDDVSFQHGFGYWDPTITEYAWDFGDGTTASGNPTSHRFTADGDYAVTLTVFARGGRTASETHVIHVRTPDTTPPEIVGTADLTANATSPAGATVEYMEGLGALDDTDLNPTLVCTPTSGSQFAIGQTSVTCVATDASGNTRRSEFWVFVLGAPDQLSNLRAVLDGVVPGTSLADKVDRAKATLDAGDVPETRSILSAFINEVRAQSGKKLDVETASAWIADATRIQAVLGS